MRRFLVSLTPEFNAQALVLDGFTGGVHQALGEHYEWLARDPFLGKLLDHGRGIYSFRLMILKTFPLTFAYRINLEAREVEIVGVWPM